MNEEEMRRHKRISLPASANLTFEEEGDTMSLQGMLADISYSGMGLYVPRQINKDAPVTICVNLLTSEGIVEAEPLKGRVVFAEFIRNTFFVGIQFYKELSPDNEPLLYNRLQNILKFS